MRAVVALPAKSVTRKMVKVFQCGRFVFTHSYGLSSYLDWRQHRPPQDCSGNVEHVDDDDDDEGIDG